MKIGDIKLTEESLDIFKYPLSLYFILGLKIFEEEFSFTISKDSNSITSSGLINVNGSLELEGSIISD